MVELSQRRTVETNFVQFQVKQNGECKVGPDNGTHGRVRFWWETVHRGQPRKEKKLEELQLKEEHSRMKSEKEVTLQQLKEEGMNKKVEIVGNASCPRPEEDEDEV